MGKQERKLAKELQKKAIKIIKVLGKKDKIKTISSFIYKKEKDFLFLISGWVSYVKDEYKIYGDIEVKPYSIDDLFWDVFDIPENKKAPQSLRVNGAFVAPSVNLFSIQAVIKSEEELEIACEELLDKFNSRIDEFMEDVSDIKSYKKYISEKALYEPRELLFILLEIQEENFEKALEMIKAEKQNNKTGGFRAGDKDIYDFAEEYCKARL